MIYRSKTIGYAPSVVIGTHLIPRSATLELCRISYVDGSVDIGVSLRFGAVENFIPQKRRSILLMPSSNLIQIMNKFSNHSKSELRREMKLVLANLDQRWLTKAHSEVCYNLIEIISNNSKKATNSQCDERHILAWIPCFPGEVDLTEFIRVMVKNSKIYLPRVNHAARMDFVQIGEDWESYLDRGERKMLQPVDGYGESFVVPDSGEIYVITPGLAFDKDGQRLGRGGGYYDRFLATPELRQRSIKIAVCWSMQIVQCVPTDNYDIAVDMLCFERGVLRVGADDA